LPPASYLLFLIYLATGQIRKVSVDALTNLAAFSFSQDGWHPFTAVLSQLSQDPNGTTASSTLKKFYGRFAPQPSEGFLPVHRDKSWKSPRECYIPPWGGGKVVTCSETFEHWTGPKSNESIVLLLERLKLTYSKLKSEGYRPWAYPDGFIRVCILENSRIDYRCLVVGGQNRAASISHMGYKHVWVRLQPKGKNYPGNMPSRIKIRELDQWRPVSHGKFSRQDASCFFEAYFEYNGKEQAKLMGLC